MKKTDCIASHTISICLKGFQEAVPLKGEVAKSIPIAIVHD